MDTSQVKNMSQMFLNCHSLKKLNLKSFETKKVEDMSEMFSGCSELTSLNVSNFDTRNVKSMKGMFSGCKNLESLDLSLFDMSNVEDISDMFSSTDSLKTLKLGEKFQVSKEQAKNSGLNKIWIDIGTGTVDNPKPDNKKGIDSTELLSIKDKGKWVVKPEKEYFGPQEVKITNNLNEDISVKIPQAIQPEYVGSIFEINVPEKKGYKADKKVVKIMALENKLSSCQSVVYTKLEGTPIPKIKGKIEDFKHYVSLHPDLKDVKVYDSTGRLTEKTLPKDYSWFSDKSLLLDDQKYYHISDNDWVKSETVYPYEKDKTKLKTKDVQIISLVDSHEDIITNRGLAGSFTMESNKLAFLNNHKYYQVSNNEFVSADKVDLIKA